MLRLIFIKSSSRPTEHFAQAVFYFYFFIICNKLQWYQTLNSVKNCHWMSEVNYKHNRKFSTSIVNFSSICSSTKNKVLTRTAFLSLLDVMSSLVASCLFCLGWTLPPAFFSSLVVFHFLFSRYYYATVFLWDLNVYKYIANCKFSCRPTVVKWFTWSDVSPWDYIVWLYSDYKMGFSCHFLFNPLLCFKQLDYWCKHWFFNQQHDFEGHALVQSFNK